MTIASLEHLIGAIPDSPLRATGISRSDPKRVVLDAMAGSAFVRPGEVAVIVDFSEARDENYKRFAEARFLEHPNLIELFSSEWVEVDGQKYPYVVTTKPDAVLADLLVDGPFFGPQLIDLVRDVLGALAYLHSENLVYGALNVNTIWRVGDQWKLADYSQLRVPAIRPIGETRKLLINREIAAPPEAYYGEITPAWDIWSLGTLLSKIARPVRTNGGDRINYAQVPLPARVDEIITSASLLEPNDRMTAGAMLELLAAPQRIVAEPAKGAGDAVNQTRIPTAAAAAERPFVEAAPVAKGAPVANGGPVTRAIERPEAERTKAGPEPWVPQPFEPERTRSFGWQRIAMVVALAVGMFALFLFLIRTTDEPGRISGRHRASAETPSSASAALPAANTALEKSPEKDLSPRVPPPSETQGTEPAAAESKDVASNNPQIGQKIEIAGLLGRWANANRRGDLTSEVNCYGPVVDTYFDRHNLSTADLLRDKTRASTSDGPVRRFDVTNLRFDQIGNDWAVASFDAKWEFGGDHPTDGYAREQVVLRSVNGEWRITSERVLGNKG